MDNQNFELILFKTGEKFLQYLLDFKEPIVRLKKIDEYAFNGKQLETLNTLNSLIEQSEILSNNNPHSNIKQYLFTCGKAFNEMRKYCGGSISDRKTSEELLNYLYLKAIEFYPCLLLVDNNRLNANLTSIESYFPLTLAEEKYIYNLLNNHPNLKNITTNENSFYQLSYRLSNNSAVNCFLTGFTGQFILRSFLNCCYRVKYDLNSLLDEVESQFSILENIAKGQTVEASFFCGIYGLKLDGIKEYQIAENITLRNIDENNNPGIKHTISNATTDKHSNAIVGCTMEYKLKLKSLGKINNSDYPITEDNLFIDKTFDNLIHSHILGLHTTYPPIKITFFERGFPLSQQFPQMHENFATGISILNQNELEVVTEWFALLNSIDTKYISLTLTRIKSAIYNRQDPIDSILDAFIAWESMFSSKTSTTSSVIKSISKILKRTDINISNSKLDKLYDLRSFIAHGNPAEHELLISRNHEQPTYEKEEIKKQTLDIALRVLKELIGDKDLFDKTPEQRVQTLLNPTLISCDKCDAKKFKFE